MEKNSVKYRVRILLWICLVGLGVGQDVEFSGSGDLSVTTNLGIRLSAPWAPIGNHVGLAWGVDAGVGYKLRPAERADG